MKSETLDAFSEYYQININEKVNCFLDTCFYTPTTFFIFINYDCG